MQALILVGGEGTPVAAAHLARAQARDHARGAAVHVLHARVAAPPRRAARDPLLRLSSRRGVRDVLGDGSEWGVELTYVEEPRPLGTGGALKYAEDLLDERFFMLNGDVLTDIDLTAQLHQHEHTGARATTRALPRRRSLGLRPRAPQPRPLGARVHREAQPGRDRHPSDQRRRLHPAALSAFRDGVRRDADLDRARALPAAGRPRPLRI